MQHKFCVYIIYMYFTLAGVGQNVIMDFFKIIDKNVDISKKKEVIFYNLVSHNMIDGLVCLKCIKSDSIES